MMAYPYNSIENKVFEINLFNHCCISLNSIFISIALHFMCLYKEIKTSVIRLMAGNGFAPEPQCDDGDIFTHIYLHIHSSQ